MFKIAQNHTTLICSMQYAHFFMHGVHRWSTFVKYTVELTAWYTVSHNAMRLIGPSKFEPTRWLIRINSYGHICTFLNDLLSPLWCLGAGFHYCFLIIIIVSLCMTTLYEFICHKCCKNFRNSWKNPTINKTIWWLIDWYVGLGID